MLTLACTLHIFGSFHVTFHKILLRITHLQLIIAKGFGGEAEHFGGEASPLPPPLDRTLAWDTVSTLCY